MFLPPDVKNRRGKQARSRKVTGVACQPGAPGRLLVTCNDSRVRLYDGYALRRKFKGPANRRATSCGQGKGLPMYRRSSVWGAPDCSIEASRHSARHCVAAATVCLPCP